ncbi:beta-1,4-galactosyltransferase [Vibrio sp. OCN044]|uniref:Beta-1,4-galactosyltransferase n=1 Tax=Vibrio tetraodonis subsp. pristinus TaxID=2695891 RepID=A0A6L8M4P4_9VIBR|nr:glycosyltransferase family 25 protein [Vibrio tetraodonis]MYM60782.1 beta-1,4-galactosyltransferase [Vibrio tetraodonis subsp. pristinus]
MKVFVINLPSSLERREKISQSLNEIGIEFELFTAIDGRKGLPADLINLPDDKHRTFFRSRPLSPGEKGCYASHYKLWQKCLEIDEPILILEDDCLPTKYFTKVFAKLPALHQKGYEYLRVEKQERGCKQIDSYGDLNIVLWADNRSGTRGYSISPSGAKKLLKYSNRWVCAVDNYIGESYRTGLICAGVQPYAIRDDGADKISTIIRSNDKSKVPIHFKLLREIYRFYRFSRMTLNFLQYKSNEKFQ